MVDICDVVTHSSSLNPTIIMHPWKFLCIHNLYHLHYLQSAYSITVMWTPLTLGHVSSPSQVSYRQTK